MFIHIYMYVLNVYAFGSRQNYTIEDCILNIYSENVKQKEQYILQSLVISALH
jgi:hypothetical protein